MKRPLIGITAEFVEDPNFVPLLGTGEQYFRAIDRAGGAPILIPSLAEPEHLSSIFEACDGLLLSGGEDVEPSHYGETPQPELQKTNPTRDKCERQLLEWALKDHVPVLAICRGMQMLNVHLGGTLHQDLQKAFGGKTIHVGNEREWKTLQHTMKIERSSQIGEILGADSIGVNNIHHQGIKTLATKLRATGQAEDGLVEAVEMIGERFVLGVQCHPELLWESEPRWLRLFEAFVQATKEYGSSVGKEYQALVTFKG